MPRKYSDQYVATVPGIVSSHSDHELLQLLSSLKQNVPAVRDEEEGQRTHKQATIFF